MPNPKDIPDPTTTMNMALVLMAKAFKLNYLTPTNNSQRISSNPRNRQIAQPVQIVGNQVVQDAFQNLGVQNVGNQNGLIVVSGIANQNLNGNDNVVAARAEGNANGNNDSVADCSKGRSRNPTLSGRQASTLGTQIDTAHVYDSEVHDYDNCYNNKIFNMFTQEEQYTKLLEPIPDTHQVLQNDSNVISEVSSMEQGRGIVEQHPMIVEETRAYFELLYNNLAIEVEKVNERNTNADLDTELVDIKNQGKVF
ncbi:hypothetical protein Tco_1019741 [Tanacetum coccineum]|uniref:Gag-Pol polyprotein n=1 Tax=Tanacetum coccineum TaxID=301880 RepID=A0ABQ5FY83_9ASTR